MTLEPGNEVKVRLLCSRACSKTSVVQIDDMTLVLALPFAPSLKLYPGDAVEVGIPGKESDPFLFKAGVLEVNKDEITLQKLTEFHCRGHRSAERIEANFDAEYVLLNQKRGAGTFRKGYLLNISELGALVAVGEQLNLSEELLLLFEIALSTVTVDKVVPTVLRGKVVREQHTYLPAVDSEQKYNYGVKFDKPFYVLSQ